MESGRDQLILGRVRQEITGELLDGKLVEGLIRVKGADQVIAIGPDGACRIIDVARGVRVARLIEPEPRPVFPKGWFSEQAIHEAFVGAGGRIRLKGFYFVGGRREAGKIKRNATRERHAVGLDGGGKFFALQAIKDEAIHGVRRPSRGVHRWQSGAHGRHVGPMLRISGALLDPGFDNGFIPVRERFAGIGRRHDVVLVVGDDAFVDFALLGLAGNDGRVAIGLGKRTFAGIEPETSFAAVATLAVFFVGTVATDAVFRKHAPDIAVKVDRLRNGRSAERNQRKPEP